MWKVILYEKLQKIISSLVVRIHCQTLLPDALPSTNSTLFWLLGASLLRCSFAVKQALTRGARELARTAERSWERGAVCRRLPQAEADEKPGPCSSCGKHEASRASGYREQGLGNQASLLVTSFVTSNTQFSKHFLALFRCAQAWCS